MRRTEKVERRGKEKKGGNCRKKRKKTKKEEGGWRQPQLRERKRTSPSFLILKGKSWSKGLLKLWDSIYTTGITITQMPI